MKGQQSEEQRKLKDLQPYRVTRILGDDIIVDLKLFYREKDYCSTGCFLGIKSIAGGVEYEFGGSYFMKSSAISKRIFYLSQRRYLFSLLVRGIRTVIDGQAENVVARFILVNGCYMTVTGNQGENVDKKRIIPIYEAVFSAHKEKIVISAYGNKFEAEINMPRFYAVLNDALDYFDSEVQRVGITLPNVSVDDDIDVFVE